MFMSVRVCAEERKGKKKTEKERKEAAAVQSRNMSAAGRVSHMTSCRLVVSSDLCCSTYLIIFIWPREGHTFTDLEFAV